MLKLVSVPSKSKITALTLIFSFTLAYRFEALNHVVKEIYFTVKVELGIN